MLKKLVFSMAIALVLPLAGCDDETKSEECTPLEEVCDGVDNDCDGVVDNGFECAQGATRACGSVVGTCEAGNETCGVTCQWSGLCEGEVVPAEEVCDAMELDENCDGSANEGCDCNEGETQECCGADPVDCTDGSFPGCPETPVETCNNIDDDCDGSVDNGIATSVDAYEPNDDCADVHSFTTALQAGEDLSITGTSYRVDGNDDVDYYLVSVTESNPGCIPLTAECLSVFFTVTDPSGGDVSFDVVSTTDASVQGICENASPMDANYYSSLDEAPVNELRVDWAGSCGLVDDMDFFIIVYTDPGVSMCSEYELTVSFPADVSCP
ncbi:hypothetical protein KKC22_05160 [Myxococcota bacterium]|nr:hypothetical protein [Myxococcota bacterium]